MLLFSLVHFTILMFYSTTFVCSGLAASQQGCAVVSPDKQPCFGPYSGPFLAPVNPKLHHRSHPDSPQATAERVPELGHPTPSANRAAGVTPQHRGTGSEQREGSAYCVSHALNAF